MSPKTQSTFDKDSKNSNVNWLLMVLRTNLSVKSAYKAIGASCFTDVDYDESPTMRCLNLVSVFMLRAISKRRLRKKSC
jgi:hypothetical protein